MKVSQEIKDWWVSALLSEETSAYPFFGRNIKVSVDEGVVTLYGSVESADESEEIEREAERIEGVRAVINHLQVQAGPERYHLQTVIAAYPDKGAAGLGRQAIASSRVHDGSEADVIDTVEEARCRLAERIKAAGLTEADMRPFLKQLDNNKVLLVDRVPEDDAFRIISAMEGSSAESIRTLPPEPGEFDGE